jgi:hypothetical protein
MVIKELKNPLTKKYFEFKNIVINQNFPLYFKNTGKPGDGDDFSRSYLSHDILHRPGASTHYIPEIRSNYFDIVVDILRDIFEYNDVKIHSFLRINLNCSLNWGGGLSCGIHVDHEFPHKNLLIYLNQSSGPTVVVNPKNNSEEYFHPKEDAIILFEGKHSAYQPNIGEKRFVLIVTFV